MSDFSLVRHLLLEAATLGAPVRAMGSTEVVTSEGELTTAEFETRVEAMRVWCRSVEKTLVDRRLPEMRIHAGFERLSRLRPVLPRYRALAARASSLHVYGLPDFDPETTGMSVVPLVEGPLVQEWFVVVKAKGFGAVIAAEDLDGFGGGDRLAERRFRGLVTHHPALVASAVSAMDAFAALPRAAGAASVQRALGIAR